MHEERRVRWRREVRGHKLHLYTGAVRCDLELRRQGRVHGDLQVEHHLLRRHERLHEERPVRWSGEMCWHELHLHAGAVRDEFDV